MERDNQSGSQNGHQDHRRITRPFKLHEALPYTPQTSGIPFIPDIIPDPTIGSGSPAFQLSDVFPTEAFTSANQEAQGLTQLPSVTQDMVEMVLRDLKPSERTSYVFRSLPKNTAVSSSRQVKSLASNLSPITKAVYDRVGTFFKATKPEATAPAKTNGQNRSDQTKRPGSSSNARSSQASPKIIEVVLSRGSFDESSYVDARGAEVEEVTDAPDVANAVESDPSAQLFQEQAQFAPYSIPQETPVPLPVQGKHVKNPGPGTGGFRVELPRSNINREDYVQISVAPDAPEDLSSRNAAQQQTGEQRVVSESLDPSQRTEAALHILDRLMRSIFTATGLALGLQTGYEHVVTVRDQEVTMTGHSQQKVHSALQKVINFKCFDRVPLEHLLTIMKLSDGSFRQLEDLDIRLDENWDEAGFEAWMERLGELDTSLKAARTCLRILSGGREEKQLYSESIIQAAIDIFKATTEEIVIPLVELRNSGTQAALFRMVAKQKKFIGGLFVTLGKLFTLLASLITQIQLAETVINTLEYTSSRLIFVENVFHDKDSALGVSRFDAIRSNAMDMLCQIFLIKPMQRQGIIDDILTSLEKLPVHKQSSRQFKLSDGASIQPVSALLMRLVQASSGQVNETNKNSSSNILRSIGDGADGKEDDPGEEKARPRLTFSIRSEEQAAEQNHSAIQELKGATAPLTDAAHRNASYIINFIVTRAVSSSKSGDTPYRNLLDLFVDDFMSCLDSPDWPSAELLLRLLMLMMVQLFEAGKTAAPAKNMALEMLGSLSATISRLRSQVKRSLSSSEGTSADDLTSFLWDLASHALEHRSQIETVAAWTGPFRITLEHLQSRCEADSQLASAVSYLISDWATRLYSSWDTMPDDEPERDRELGRLAFRLRMMTEDKDWLAKEYTFKTVSPSQAKLSYSLVLLCSPLCESFNKILNILLGSMASDQATVRSKSLKSINQVLDTDPGILDGDSQVIQLIIECSSDSSPQVRDSALGLLGNCITKRPSLESPSIIKILIDRFQDAGVGVRKRAMKLARDIYLRNRSKVLRSGIANGLLRRITDPDEGVRDLARQMIEEVWFAPFYQQDETAEFQTALADHVNLVIQTVKNGTVTEILDKVFQAILRPQNREKYLEGPFSVCVQMVSEMLNMVNISDPDDPTAPSGRDSLQVLTIFAKAEATLFNMEQIRLLKPQLSSWAGVEELAAFRAVTVIYRRVLPVLSAVSPEFLQEVRGQLQKAVGKVLSRGAFDDLIACFKVCCELLNDFGPLANLVCSGITGIQKLPKANLDGKPLGVLSAYAIIIGCVAKHCDLDRQMHIFRARFPQWKGDSVPRFIVDTLTPFASQLQPLDARKAALEAIGLVCQAWPRNYVLAQVYTCFQQVFQEEVAVLESMILKSFKDFLTTEEKRSERQADDSGPKKKELTVMGGTNFDDVASATTQRFLKDIARIATSSQDDLAFLAMEVLASINRQGLTHPKETGVTLMTLETSSNRMIADLAFAEHRSLHEKHETVLEREYVKAVQSAFVYQRDVVKDMHGAVTDPFQSKLHLLMEVLKISKTKNRQRFFEKLCAQVDFDMEKLRVGADGVSQHVAFAQFISENLAFFEYQTVGELHFTVNKMEKIVTSTGATIAQAIESEVFNVRMDVDQPDPVASSSAVDGDTAAADSASAAPALPDVEPSRLQQLSSGAVILLALWEVRTFLRKLYGLGTNRPDSKVKALAKDLNKAPTKAQGVQSEKFWDELQTHYLGMQSVEMMVQRCKTFVELLNVDKEFQVTKEGDDDLGMGGDPATPSDGEEDDGQERGRKRKAAGSTPGGRKKRPRSSSQQRKRGRPKKVLEASPDEDADGEFDGDWV